MVNQQGSAARYLKNIQSDISGESCIDGRMADKRVICIYGDGLKRLEMTFIIYHELQIKRDNYNQYVFALGNV